MNKELYRQLIDSASEKLSGWDGRRGNFTETVLNRQKLIELVVAECINECKKNMVKIVGPNTVIFNSAVSHCINNISSRFEVFEFEESETSEPIGY